MPSIKVSCVICDDVRHEKNGKSILIGTYNDIILVSKSNWDDNDSKIFLPQIYFANFMSGVPRGSLDLVLWIEDPDGDLFGMKEKKETKIIASDWTCSLMFRITPVLFNKLGNYRFHLEGSDFKYYKEFEVRVAEKFPE